MLRETSCACNRKLFSKLIYSATQKNLFNSIRQLSSHNVWAYTQRTPLWYHNSHCTPYYRKPDYFLRASEYIQQEIAKDKQREENFKKFEEAKKIQQPEALRTATRKLENMDTEFCRCSEKKFEKEKKFEVESENVDSEFCTCLEDLKKKLQTMTDNIQKIADQIHAGKKTNQVTEELNKSERNVVETFPEKGERIDKVSILTRIVQAVKKTVRDNVIEVPVYKPPFKLTKEIDVETFQDIKPNEQATSVVVCKKSLFDKVWKNLKDNRFVDTFLDWKIMYEESDNPIIEASRFLTDNISDIIREIFRPSELSQALTEIYEFDPNFDKVTFLRDCETYIIPNVMEGMIRGDLDALRDWCHEGSFNMLAEPIREAITAGYHFDSVILDIDNLDLVDGKVADQGPALAIAFTSQEITCLRDSQGNVVKGDPYKVMRMEHLWVLYRVRKAINSNTAWKLLESSIISSSEQFI